MKPPRVMLKQLDYFVGRQKTLEEIQKSLKDTGCLYLDFLEGVEGIGKTTLLVKLYSDLKEQKTFNPIWVCMTVFDPVRKGERAEPESVVILANNLDDYRMLLLELASEFSDEAFAGFAAHVEALFTSQLSELIKKEVKVDLSGVTVHTGNIHVGAFSRLAEGQFKTGDVVVKVPDHQIRMVIDHLKNAITQEFVRRINTIEKKSRCVFLMDNFQLVLNEEVGGWFLSGVAAKLENAVVVLAKTKTALAVKMQDSVVIFLENFSKDDVKTYLQKRLDLNNYPPDLPKAIHQYTGGHPQAVVLAVDVCESLAKKGIQGKALRELFKDIPAEHSGKIIKLVEKIRESIDDKEVLQALEIGWVLRRFDADILRHLLTADENAGGGEGAKKYQDIISRLEEYSFTENHGEFYKFHDFIRQGMEGRFKKNDPKTYAAIHHRAADYYGGKLIAYDKDRRDESSYRRWYRYESSEWQVLITEWLYHLKYTPERGLARFMFLKVYFDAFWWWGVYESFPFCERLLSEWRRTQMSDDDKNWSRHVQNFHDSYPTGYQKRGKGHWDQVQTALCCLRQLAGLDTKLSKLDAAQRHVRAIMDIFLAQAHFYQERKDPKAEEYFLEALKIFEDDGDEWNTLWALYYLADLYMKEQANEKAAGLCRRALQGAGQTDAARRDYEIIANVHRVLADLYWQTGEKEKSLRHHVYTIGSSYLYHGFPSPADLYTRSLQKEMMERAAARLKNLYDEGKKSEALKYCGIFLEFFLPYRNVTGQPSPDAKALEECLAQTKSEALMAYLFPRLPKDEELNQKGSEYTDQVQCLLEKLAPPTDMAADSKSGVTVTL